MRIGLITNVRSRRNQRLLPRLRAAVAAADGMLSAELDGVDGLEEALCRFAAGGVTVVVVVGGDGTVQAALTLLLRGDGCGFVRQPDLAVLAGGTTNMTASDVGVRGRPDRAVDRLVRLVRANDDCLPGEVAERNVIEVMRPGEMPLYGMFFGTGAICRAIRLARRSVHPIGLGSSLESGVTLAGILGQRLIGRISAESDPVLRGDDMSICRDGGAAIRQPTLLALSTTLHRLLLRSRPFWGQGDGPLRCTRIAYPAPRFGRSVPGVLYGWGRSRLPPGQYSSCNAERVRLEMDCPFTLDGEIFEACRDAPIELSGHRRIRFLRF